MFFLINSNIESYSQITALDMLLFFLLIPAVSVFCISSNVYKKMNIPADDFSPDQSNQQSGITICSLQCQKHPTCNAFTHVSSSDSCTLGTVVYSSEAVADVTDVWIRSDVANDYTASKDAIKAPCRDPTPLKGL
jgi:hypothetical protein